MPESPIPRKRAQLIESDSEEELFKHTPTPPQKGGLKFAAKSKSPPPEVMKDGKRRVKKTITTVTTDDEGFTGESCNLPSVSGNFKRKTYNYFCQF